MKYQQQQRIQHDKAEAFTFIQKLNFILAKIRETDVGMMATKSSDDPNKKAIAKVLFPPEGGVLTQYDDCEHPAKGFCYGETVETVDFVKKVFMAFLRGFFGGMEKSRFKMILFVLLFKKQFQEILFNLVSELDYGMHTVRQKPIRYCRCGREVFRVFGKMMIWYPKWADFLGHLRNIVCMILEYDDAYRYPAQDVVPEFNEEAGRKDILKEIDRLLGLVVKWDHRGTAEKFGRIRKLLFLLRFNKSLKVALSRFFLELNLDEIRMDEADRYHARFKWGYNWNHDEDYDPENHDKSLEKYEQEKKEKEIQK